jgi:CRP-like cAMP-binding protein
VFGEIGLLRGVPRTATVTALSEGTLYALDGADFAELMGSGPGLGSRLLDVYRGAIGRS